MQHPTTSLPVEVRSDSGGVFAAMVVRVSAYSLAALTRQALAPGERVLLRLRVRPGARDAWLQASVLITRPCDAGIWTRQTLFELIDADGELIGEIRAALQPASRPGHAPAPRRLFAA